MKKEKKKICLVIHSLQAGGMERVMAELANYFSDKKNVRVHLVLYGIKRDIFYPLSGDIIIHKPPFEFNDKQRIFSIFKTIFFLRKTFKKIRPSTILSFGEYWNNFVLIAAYKLKYPVYVSDRSQPDKSLGKFQDVLRKRLYPAAKGVIAQTQKAKQLYFSMYGHQNIVVIGNPVRSIENLNGQIHKENIVLMVGRLIKTKHQDKLIELFARINKPGWKLVLVGYDHLKQNNMEKLLQLAKDLNVEDRVVFAGKRSDVEHYYLKSKVFAFTSSSEGFPNVIGEAMSAGLPVIAFDCVAGPSEMIIDNENGFLVSLFDYEMFNNKLEKLMGDEALRNKIGNRAQKDIKQFDVSIIGERFYNFIMPSES